MKSDEIKSQFGNVAAQVSLVVYHQNVNQIHYQKRNLHYKGEKHIEYIHA